MPQFYGYGERLLSEEQFLGATEPELRQLAKKYSDFVEHPIVMDVTKEGKTEEETLNARKAIWLRPRSEVTQEEYNQFYKHLSHDMEDPVKTIHYSAEGAIEFKALLYLPSRKLAIGASPCSTATRVITFGWPSRGLTTSKRTRATKVAPWCVR